MSVSHWERGILEVPAKIYIKLGNLAGDPLCWYFWGRSGLHSEDVMRVLPAARNRLHENRRVSVLVVMRATGKRRRRERLILSLFPSCQYMRPRQENEVTKT